MLGFHSVTFCIQLILMLSKTFFGFIGSRVGGLQNVTRSPFSPVLGHRNPSRHSSKKSTDMPLYVAEGNLPLPFGKYMYVHVSLSVMISVFKDSAQSKCF